MKIAKQEYALYKGEVCLAIGTADEIAEQLKVKKETIWFYLTPSYYKRRKNSKKGDYRILIKLDDDDED